MQFEAIGTHWWLELYEGKTFSDELRGDILAYAEDFNAQYSRFHTSLVGQLNKGKKVEYPPAELLAMLAFSRELYEASEGAFVFQSVAFCTD